MPRAAITICSASECPKTRSGSANACLDHLAGRWHRGRRSLTPPTFFISESYQPALIGRRVTVVPSLAHAPSRPPLSPVHVPSRTPGSNFRAFPRLFLLMQALRSALHVNSWLQSRIIGPDLARAYHISRWRTLSPTAAVLLPESRFDPPHARLLASGTRKTLFVVCCALALPRIEQQRSSQRST